MNIELLCSSGTYLLLLRAAGPCCMFIFIISLHPQESLQGATVCILQVRKLCQAGPCSQALTRREGPSDIYSRGIRCRELVSQVVEELRGADWCRHLR